MSAEIQIVNPEARFSPEQETMLDAPLEAKRIKERKGGGGKLLKYIKGDDGIDTANRIFGKGRWGYKVLNRSHELVEDRKKGPIDIYTADIELYVAGATFPFPGDGVGVVNDPYTVEMHEKARKEATTDALKRALRHYGDQFGLCLYNEDDYVDAGDGTLVQVKEVKPGAKVQQPKRVVDAPAQRRIEQLAQDVLKARLNGLFNRAKALGVLSAPTANAFLSFASEIVGTAITQPDQLDQGKLDDVEAEIAAKGFRESL